MKNQIGKESFSRSDIQPGDSNPRIRKVSENNELECAQT